ncbi:MAG: NAD(P)/FAD-dependent oxidoreductase [Clostridiales bacterium]
MIKQIELTVEPPKAHDSDTIKKYAALKLKLDQAEIKAISLLRRSIDARSKEPFYKVLVDIYINEEPEDLRPQIKYPHLSKDSSALKKVAIVGFGPAGMFAALRLIEAGIKPVIVERGKDVQARRRDLRAIQQYSIVNPDSNYCFGEGGAGTYSDGKLYTRSTKRGDVKKILNVFVQHGAIEDILIDAHPHIGSNKLPKIVQSIRQTILSCGGEIFFESRLTDFLISENKVNGIVINDQKEIPVDSVILATGHSARDIFYLCHRRNIRIEPKPFAMGVRIEHPQNLIDEIQYHKKNRGEYLPAASYSLTCQVKERGVFSFCMCPGGIIIPASTAPGELVLNGMSVSKRDSMFANSGFVVTIGEKEWKGFEKEGVFAGLEYQKQVERISFEAGGFTQRAPAQRITDFVNRKLSSTLPKSSYIPGIVSSPLHELLPKNISQSLREALLLFSKKMKGYYTEEAQILAAETRTSSPIRIPRDKDTLMHTEIEGLFPAGEGAGYAGGIVSAAIDGENCAEAAVKYLSTK